MILDFILGGAAFLGLLGYLVYALAHSEEF